METEALLRINDCDAVLIAALGGVRGSGFSVAIKDPVQTLSVMRALPKALREIAAELESDLEAFHAGKRNKV